MDNTAINSAPDQEAKPFEGTTYEMNRGVNPREAGLSCESALGYELWETFKFIKEIDFDDHGNGDPEDLIPPIAKALYENFNRVNQLYAKESLNWTQEFDEVTEDELIKNVVLVAIQDAEQENHKGAFNLIFHRSIQQDRVWGGLYLSKIACLVVEEGKKIEHIAGNWTAGEYEVGKHYRMIYDKQSTKLKDVVYVKEETEWQQDG